MEQGNSSSESAPDSQQPRLADELLGLSGGQFVGRVLGGTLMVAVCGVVLTSYYARNVGVQPAMIWLGLLLVVLTMRIALVAQLHYSRFLDHRSWPWILLYPIGLNLTSAWIGFGGGWIVWHTSIGEQQMLWLVIVSLCALSVSAIALLTPWFLLTPAMALGGPLFALYLRGEPGFKSLTAFSLIFFVGLAFFYRRQGALLRQFIDASVSNTELIDTLNVKAERLKDEIREREEAEQRIRLSENEHRALMENVHDLIYRMDPDGKLLQVSPSISEVLGFTPEEVIGRNLREFLTRPEIMDEITDAMRAGNGTLTMFKHQIRHKDGSVIWLSANAKLTRDDSGQALAIWGSSRDITDTLKTERALQMVQDRAQTTLDSIADGVITTDTLSVIEFLNPVAERMTGWRNQEAKGELLSRVLRVFERRSGRPIVNPVERCVSEGRTTILSGNLSVRNRQDDRESGIEVTASPMAGENGVLGAVIVLHDVTRVQDMAREISYQASHDRLTGLINRGEFEVQVQEAIDSADDQNAHALLHLDLDQFKIVNDSGGHAAGDELLRQLSGQLLEVIRDSDVLARIGGDEFGVLLSGCDVDNASRVAENIRTRVKEFRFQWQDKTFELGVSIGLVPITNHCGDLTDVLKAADSACSLAKDLGRNRIHLFHAEDERVAQRQGQAQWVQRIRESLESDQFELHIQTIKPLKNKAAMKGGEILLRLRDGSGQLIPPNAFLPAAERYHLMPRIDRWVVARSMELIAKRPTSLLGYGEFSINVSGQTLNDDGFLKFVIETLHEFDVDPGRLCFEITETAVIANLYKATRMITKLKELGCHFALDDFGSGLSSFQYLKQLSVDKLKIDGVFIRDVANDPVDYAMVKAIVQVGEVMGIETIAEYVENGEIMACLKTLGLDYAQGFYISRPTPIV